MIRDYLIVAISSVLEHGDKDGQPWVLYEDDRWPQVEAEVERADFIEAVIAKMEELGR